MDNTDQLQKEVRNLSLAVRLGLSVLIAMFVLKGLTAVGQAPKFQAIFDDLLEGTQLPVLTNLFLTFAIPLGVVISILGLGSIVLLFASPRQVWTIPVGVAVAVVSIVVAEVAVFAFQLPLIRIISLMSQ